VHADRIAANCLSEGEHLGDAEPNRDDREQATDRKARGRSARRAGDRGDDRDPGCERERVPALPEVASTVTTLNLEEHRQRERQERDRPDRTHSAPI